MPIEDSASSVLGPDSRMRPTSMKLFPTGGTSNSVSLGQFRALDRRYMQRAEEILTFRDKVATLQEREAARVQGNMAMRDISSLDPTAPDYLSKRNEIISRYPKAALDETANKFLDLQEDEHRIQQAQRDYDQRRADAQQDRLDYLAQNAKTQEVQQLAMEARQRNEDVRRMSSAAQRTYHAALGSMPPNEAFVLAQKIEDEEKRELEFLRSGGQMSDLQVPVNDMSQGPPDPRKLRPATERELAEKQGAVKRSEREKEAKTNRLKDLQDQYKLIQDQIEAENERLDSDAMLDLKAEERAKEQKKIQERVAKLQAQAEPLRTEMANLRGFPETPQGAGEPVVPTGGGSVSSITGQPINPSGFVKPR